jgi:peptide/nickel transport system permease protein
MGRYIIKNIISAIIVMLAVSIISFSLIRLAPGDPAVIMAMARYGNEVTPEQIQWIGKEMGLHAPVYKQYMIWLDHILEGDFGISVRTDQPVISEILIRLPVTLKLGIISLVLSLVLSMVLGVVSAMKKGSLFDRSVMSGTLVLISFPNYWLALLLILLFSVKLSLLPVFGQGSIRHFILPCMTLAVSMAAFTTRLVRTCVLEELEQDYIRTARSKGLKEGYIILFHAVRNALLPVVTYTGLKFARIFQVAVIIETIFAWEGIGKLVVDSCFARDYPVVQACVLMIAAVFVLINLLVDISYVYLDPRIRFDKA